VTPPLLEVSGIVKSYHGLRPLRVAELVVTPGDEIALLGLDRPAAEVFVNLITGATLPEEGTVSLFGRESSAIQDSQEWLSLVDRFGIVSERAVLLEGLSVAQNLALPFSLEIEPPSDEVLQRAQALADAAGIRRDDFGSRVADLPASDRMRVRAGRALAFDPLVVLFEHPTSGLARSEVAPFARDVRALAARRNVATLILTADAEFAAAAASRVLTLDPSSGRLGEAGARGWWRRQGNL
jgi:ABC-type transporter Mla maintaining outer membrane lipid asymmetry ATPase subunit MlaF